MLFHAGRRRMAASATAAVLVAGLGFPALAPVAGLAAAASTVRVLGPPNTWVPAGSMRSAHTGQTATLLPNGKVLVAGGFVGKYPNQNTTAGATLYDPATNSWSTAGSLQVARARQTASLLPTGQVLVAGGQHETRDRLTSLTSAELYSP